MQRQTPIELHFPAMLAGARRRTARVQAATLAAARLAPRERPSHAQLGSVLQVDQGAISVSARWVQACCGALAPSS